IAVRYRVLLLRPDAWSSGLASFRRLSARDAGHVHRDTCLWNAVKPNAVRQLASRLHELGRPRFRLGRLACRFKCPVCPKADRLDDLSVHALEEKSFHLVASMHPPAAPLGGALFFEVRQ